MVSARVSYRLGPALERRRRAPTRTAFVGSRNKSSDMKVESIRRMVGAHYEMLQRLH